MSLNKIWSALSSLRYNISQAVSLASTATTGSSTIEKLLTFPDPLPPPASALSGRSLRSVRTPTDTVNVVQTSQMIPVIVSLVQSAIETKVVRDELDQGLKDNKNIVREAKEAIRIENARWEEEKKTMDNRTNDKAQKTEVELPPFFHGFLLIFNITESHQAIGSQRPNGKDRERRKNS